MSERGVFAIDRGIFDHPSFADEPFTEREAWAWLIAQACWKPQRRRVGSVSVNLLRGQVSHSLRFMAGKWQWSEARVRRFLGRLKIDAMIDAAAGAGVTIITICNYNKYQRVSLPADAATDAPIDAGATQERRKEEGIKDIQGSEPNGSDAGASKVYADATHELWDDGTATLVQLGLSTETAKKNIGKWLRDAKDPSKVLGAIHRARHARTQNPIPFVTGALKTTGPPPRKSGFLELALELGNTHERPDNLEQITDHRPSLER